MDDIRFEDLPPDHRGKNRWSRWTAIGEQLRQRPGEWAIVACKPTPGAAGAAAYAIEGGLYAGLGSVGMFEAKSRTVDGEYRVYARYVGGQP